MKLELETRLWRESAKGATIYDGLGHYKVFVTFLLDDIKHVKT